MSEFKGTPGPWEYKKIHGENQLIVKGSHKKLGHGIVSYQHVDADSRENQKLIAAAPELLEALQDALYAYDKHGEHSEWDLARAAIKKALGQ